LLSGKVVRSLVRVVPKFGYAKPGFSHRRGSRPFWNVGNETDSQGTSHIADVTHLQYTRFSHKTPSYITTYSSAHHRDKITTTWHSKHNVTTPRTPRRFFIKLSAISSATLTEERKLATVRLQRKTTI